ncbi:MAG: hypothetical protein GY820_29730, partial [Gammaproteobacteria bacterium]|nr:hypothetical protein [Gammaproteobacteria bacterium]
MSGRAGLGPGFEKSGRAGPGLLSQRPDVGLIPNYSPRVQPILVGSFLFDRYWMDLEFKKNRGVLADPQKMQRFFKVALPKKSNFGPLLLVADWSTEVETMLPPKLPTRTTTYPNGVEIEV